MKVIGYYNSFTRQEEIFNLDLKAITHINYAFLLPKEDGRVYFYDVENVKKVVEFAHKNNKKIYVSVGGYCDHSKVLSKVFETICNDMEVFHKFISNVVNVVEKYDFDGLDLDWEYPWIEYTKSFEYMVVTLRYKLGLIGKGFTIAVHRAIKGQVKSDRIVSITDIVIKNVDWMNIMTYDETCENNHSSFLMAQRCIKYWCTERNVPKEKIMIGIPFYARPSAKPFAEIVAMNKKNYFNDYCNDDSYNGCHTVKEKAYFARFNCGGLIIWAINYDSPGEYSLLKVINEAK